jgi:predicted small metal-binding protein
MSVSSIAAPQTPRPKPRFIFSDQSSVIDTYESYAKEGFVHLMTNQANFLYEFEKQFLSKVDLTKGPIFVSVGAIIRTIAVDCDFKGGGDTEEELIKNFVDHAIKDHGYTRVDVMKPELQEKIKAHIQKS